jgi:biopolymer transport protein ExbD
VGAGFYTKKRRAPSIIIVSLIDILAILLIFFIVTTTFKKDQPQLKIALPELRRVNEGNPGRGIALQADEGVPFRAIVKIIDALRDAGIRNLPAFARPAGSAE